jgi:hypothetical protein
VDLFSVLDQQTAKQKPINEEMDMEKICTYCGMAGHRASQCPHLRAAEACTELGFENENGDLVSPFVWFVLTVAIASCVILIL